MFIGNYHLFTTSGT